MRGIKKMIQQYYLFRYIFPWDVRRTEQTNWISLLIHILYFFSPSSSMVVPSSQSSLNKNTNITREYSSLFYMYLCTHWIWAHVMRCVCRRAHSINSDFVWNRIRVCFFVLSIFVRLIFACLSRSYQLLCPWTDMRSSNAIHVATHLPSNDTNARRRKKITCFIDVDTCCVALGFP